MAVENPVQSLTASLESAFSALPELDSLNGPVENGISLLDTKIETFAAYIQHLTLLILSRLRDPSQELSSSLVDKLVELRLYLDKGIKPLEGRLQYQIDKVVRAADESQAQTTKTNGVVNGKSGKTSRKGEDASGSEDSDEEDEVEEPPAVDPMSYRPRPSAFRQLQQEPSQLQQEPSRLQESKSTTKSNTGIYKPPRITPVSYPNGGQREDKAARIRKSHNMDDYIAEELSTAPVSQPSIGSNLIPSRVHETISRAEAKSMKERNDYEEANYTRLPSLSKKEKAKFRNSRGSDRVGFGGEEFFELGRGADRLIESTARKGKESAVERSRKRMRETGDTPGSSGVVGQKFEMKRQKMMERMQRKGKR